MIVVICLFFKIETTKNPFLVLFDIEVKIFNGHFVQLLKKVQVVDIILPYI